MGLIHVPRGIGTKRGYAPADIARSAAESAAPWVWNQGISLYYFGVSGREPSIPAEYTSSSPPPDLVLADHLGRNHPHGYFNDGRDKKSRILNRRGPSIEYDGAASDFAQSFITNSAHTYLLAQNDGCYYIFFYIADVTKSTVLIGQFNGGLATLHQYGCGMCVQSGTIRAVRAANNTSANVGASLSPGLHFAACQFSGSEVRLFLDGRLYTGSCQTSGQNYDWAIGNSGHAYSVDDPRARLNGHIYTAGLFGDSTSIDELASLGTDPFAPFRRRPLLVPVSSGSGATTGTITDGAQGSDGWVAVAIAPGAVTEPVQAGDTLSSVATVGMALTEAVSAQDSDAGPAQALGAVTESVTGNDLADAVAQISAAITAGASAGESWVAQAQALVDLVESGAAGDTVTQGAQDVTAAAISEGSQAGETFVAAVEAVASITGASTASDALIAALVAIGSVTESAQASGTFTASTETLVSRSITHAANASDSQSAVAQIVSALTEAIDAAALYTASAAVAQSIAEAVQAGDAWSAVVPGTGYLVASAITITAALSGSINIKPSLSGSVRIKPD